MKLVLAAVVATCLLGICESRPTIDLNQPLGEIGGVQGPAEGTSNEYDNLLRNITNVLRELINIIGSEMCETVKITIETVILSVVEIALNTVTALSGDLKFINQSVLDVLRFYNALVPEYTNTDDDGKGTPISEITSNQINLIDIISIMNNFTQYLSVESNSTNKVFNILHNIIGVGDDSDGSDSGGSDSDGSDSDGQNSCGSKCAPCANHCTCKVCK
uniref:Uncharacterized protein n=1 Tax=Homalodisca liturata TaxID=320908 RepID=A0A1B6JL82_9HEMI